MGRSLARDDSMTSRSPPVTVRLVTQPLPPPGWYPDPAGSGGTRWWNGVGWTDTVHAPPTPGSSLYDQPVLLVNQKTKLIELTNEYAVLDGDGRQIGAVVQVGQSGLKKSVRFFSRLDQFFTHRLEVRDTRGPVLVLTRPVKVLKSRVLVSRPDGTPVGEIVQANVFGRIRFDFVVAGRLAGAIQAENWRAWDFAITDGAGTEIARIAKSWEGLARTLFTTADRYVVRIHVRVPEPLVSLVLASALTIDNALKQDGRGFN
jgi:uncharacterized protein YxjI